MIDTVYANFCFAVEQLYIHNIALLYSLHHVSVFLCLIFMRLFSMFFLLVAIPAFLVNKGEYMIPHSSSERQIIFFVYFVN